MTVKPIAHINVVPFQRFTGTVKVGVVAFAKASITSVAFSISDTGNGGSTTETPTVYSMTLNDRTNTWEYWTEIYLSSGFDDGDITIDALVTDGDANTRACPQVTIRNNDGGSLPTIEKWVDAAVFDDTGAGTEGDPYKTIGKAISAIYTAGSSNCDGGIVYLKAGTHLTDRTSYFGTYNCTDEFLTITAASGLSNSDVTLQGSGTAPKINRVRFHGIGITGQVFWTRSDGDVDWAWHDGCKDVGSSTTALFWQNIPTKFYMTDTTVNTVKWGSHGADFCRGVDIDSVIDDAFVHVPCIINCTATNVDPLATSNHADLWQYYSSANWDNLLMFNVRGTMLRYQGMFVNSTDGGWSASNVAWVNVLAQLHSPINFDGIEGGDLLTWKEPCEHLLFWHLTLIYDWDEIDEGEGMVAIRDTVENTDITYGDFRGCKFNKTACDASPQVTFDANTDFTDCHVDTASSNQWENLLDSGKTSGDAGLDSNFRPAAGSTLIGRLSRIVPCDADNLARDATTAVGAFRGPAEGDGVLLSIRVHTRTRTKII